MGFNTVTEQVLTTGQTWFLTGLIVVLTLIGAADIVGDLSEGASLMHILVEAPGIAVGVLGLGWVWFKNKRLEAHEKKLTTRLTHVNQDARIWQERAQQYLLGLNQSIEEQLNKWGLTSAEKDVAWLLLKGLSLIEISQVRGTSVRTIRQQNHSIYRKSNLAGRAELSAFFLEDLLAPPKLSKD